MKTSHYQFIAIALILFALPVVAQTDTNCDCGTYVGECQASIRVEPTGSTGNYGADLKLISTAPICSKIDYYIDSTPYFTILSQGYRGEDRILGIGSRSVTTANLHDVTCRVCKSNKTSGTTQTTTSPRTSNFLQSLNGRWCADGDTSRWNVWTVNGNTLSYTNFAGQPGSSAIVQTGENSFTVAGEEIELIDSNTHIRKGLFYKRFTRCD